MTMLAEGIRVVDADSHMTERHDLFTERAPKGFEDKVPHVEKIDGMDMWVIDGHTFGKAGSGGTIDPQGNKHPFIVLAGRVVEHPRRAPRGVGPQRAPEADGRVRHRLPGALPERDRHRRPEPRQHDQGSVAGAVVPPALQRRHGRGAGEFGQPPAPDADHAGVEHRGVRPRGEAVRGDGLPRREHDVGPAGLGLARPRSAPTGTRCGTCARSCSCRCTSTSARARRR